jgi:Zn-dependent protease with chaperone function
MPYTYPEGPQHVSDEILRPSPAFKREVAKIVTSLFLFVCLYFVLLAASVGIAILLGWLALAIVSHVHNIWVILFSLGLVAVGGLSVFFLVKFLFSVKKEDRSNYTEATEAEYPDLFDFIRRISQETGTDFPKHIYLSHEVNAFVFYDSSFKSLFLPVKKNLTIGLGLVNMTNLSELKAVIAHEFGHFSQKSMKAGSYVYQANKVIYNMLYENKDFSDVISSISSGHAVLAMCMNITVQIVRAFQWILQQAYRGINKTYSGLSRQMEFNADAMAAKVAGSNNAIHALRRIEFADAAYNAAIECYNQWLPEGYKGVNLYTQQVIVAKFLADKFELPVQNELPVLADGHTKPDSFSRVNVKDQWASHPTMPEREESLKRINVQAPVTDELSWVLFPNARELQKQFTSSLYENVTIKEEVKELNDIVFRDKFYKEHEDNSYPVFYKSYYNGRYIEPFDADNIQNEAIEKISDIAAFIDGAKNDHKKMLAAGEDANTMEYISGKNSGIRTFDFDGEKYKKGQAKRIKDILDAEVQNYGDKINANDKAVYRYFVDKAAVRSQDNGAAVKDLYKKYFEAKKIGDENEKVCEHIYAFIRPFYEEQSMEKARQTAADLKEATPFFVLRIEKVQSLLAEAGLENVHPFPESISPSRISYMSYQKPDGHFNDANLNELLGYLNSFSEWSRYFLFKMQKRLTEEQLVLSGHVV